LSYQRTAQLNLKSLHRECERNYVGLMSLFAGKNNLGQTFTAHDCQRNAVTFTIIEVTKFTTTVAVALENMAPQWVPEIDLKVRAYHDAKMAEVIEWCSDRTIPWALVEDKGRQSRDEKWQWNIFLSELLSQRLKQSILEAQSK
jgi:uncharacterized protein YqiB (DUF1249 family)